MNTITLESLLNLNTHEIELENGSEIELACDMVDSALDKNALALAVETYSLALDVTSIQMEGSFNEIATENSKEVLQKMGKTIQEWIKKVIAFFKKVWANIKALFKKIFKGKSAKRAVQENKENVAANLEKMKDNTYEPETFKFKTYEPKTYEPTTIELNTAQAIKVTETINPNFIDKILDISIPEMDNIKANPDALKLFQEVVAEVEAETHEEYVKAFDAAKNTSVEEITLSNVEKAADNVDTLESKMPKILAALEKIEREIQWHTEKICNLSDPDFLSKHYSFHGDTKESLIEKYKFEIMLLKERADAIRRAMNDSSSFMGLNGRYLDGLIKLYTRR